MKKLSIGLLMMALFLPSIAMSAPQEFTSASSIYSLSHHSSHSNSHSNNSHSNNNSYDNDHHNNSHSNNNTHNGPSIEVKRAHQTIKRMFQKAEDSYYPFLMSNSDKREMGRAMKRLVGELANMNYIINKRYREDIRQISKIVERARFALTSENSAKEAHKKLEKANRLYRNLMDKVIH